MYLILQDVELKDRTAVLYGKALSISTKADADV